MWNTTSTFELLSNTNLTTTFLVLLAVVALSGAYGIRLILRGRAQSARVDKQGGSALLSKGMMEMAHWWLQPLGRLLVSLHATPNMISWTSLFFGLLAGICLGYGHFGFGGFFALLSGFMDSLDGMVARMSGTSSDAGEILDATVDRYVEGFFLAGLIVYYHHIPALQVLAIAALLGSFMVSYSSAKAEALQIDPPKGSMRRPERALYLTLGAILSPITISLFESVPYTIIPVGHPMVLALGLVAVLANASAIERMYFLAKAIRLREAEALKRQLAAARAAQGEASDGHHAAEEKARL